MATAHIHPGPPGESAAPWAPDASQQNHTGAHFPRRVPVSWEDVSACTHAQARTTRVWAHTGTRPCTRQRAERREPESQPRGPSAVPRSASPLSGLWPQLGTSAETPALQRFWAGPALGGRSPPWSPLGAPCGHDQGPRHPPLQPPLPSSLSPRSGLLLSAVASPTAPPPPSVFLCGVWHAVWVHVPGWGRACLQLQPPPPGLSATETDTLRSPDSVPRAAGRGPSFPALGGLSGRRLCPRVLALLGRGEHTHVTSDPVPRRSAISAEPPGQAPAGGCWAGVPGQGCTLRPPG